MLPPRGGIAPLLSLLILLPAAAAADTKAVFESTGGQETGSYAVKDRMVRWESDELRQNRQYMLFDGNRNVMILVDDGRKMIMEFDEATLKRQRQRMQAQMQPMMKQLQEQMKHMTPEQRRMMERQMGGLMKGSQGGAGPTFSTKEIGRDRINGIPCRRVDVRRNGQPTYELCVASRSDARIPKQDYDTLMRMFAFMRNIAKMGTAAPPIPENINGVPMRMKNHANGEVQTVKKISTSTLPAGPFKSPSYPKQDLGAPMRR